MDPPPPPERRPRQPKRTPPPPTTELRRSKRIKALTEVNSGVDAASEPPQPKTKAPKHVKATATETPKNRETKPKLPKAPKQTESKKRVPVTLSQWAVAHFLASREQRRGCRIEDDAPLEPLDDHILRDFSTRFRGSAGDVEADKEDAVAMDGEGGDESESRSGAKRVALVVGAPQNNSYPFSHATTFDMASRAGMGAYGKRPQYCTATFEVRLSAEERESRYFGKDLALKCSICRRFGHSTSLCAKNKSQKLCSLCGLRGHSAVSCSQLPCAKCQRVGHSSVTCSRNPPETVNCGICGRSGHKDDDCTLDLASSHTTAKCAVCTKPGHLHCMPIQPPADTAVFCSNCAKGHALSECPSHVKQSQPIYTVISYPVDRRRRCFICDSPNHLAADCSGGSDEDWDGDYSCWKCGRYGHTASNCWSRY